MVYSDKKFPVSRKLEDNHKTMTDAQKKEMQARIDKAKEEAQKANRLCTCFFG